MSEGPTKRGRGRLPDHGRREKTEQLRRRGLTLKQIGARLGVSHQAVHELLDRIGFPRCRVVIPRTRPRLYKPALTVRQILAWADAYHARHGLWPNANSGQIPGSGGESWKKVNSALYLGTRGLPGGSSLARLLAEKRNARGRAIARDLSEALILVWAERHRRLKGKWPRHDSGAVPGVSGETWFKVNLAMAKGYRGLPGGESLAKLLRRHGRIP